MICGPPCVRSKASQPRYAQMMRRACVEIPAGGFDVETDRPKSTERDIKNLFPPWLLHFKHVITQNYRHGIKWTMLINTLVRDQSGVKYGSGTPHIVSLVPYIDAIAYRTDASKGPGAPGPGPNLQ